MSQPPLISKGKIMGKYQLDYKGMQQVERFHEKNTMKRFDKQARVRELRARFLAKTKQQSAQKD